jgi:hypothetical protein
VAGGLVQLDHSMLKVDVNETVHRRGRGPFHEARLWSVHC